MQIYLIFFLEGDYFLDIQYKDIGRESLEVSILSLDHGTYNI